MFCSNSNWMKSFVFMLLLYLTGCVSGPYLKNEPTIPTLKDVDVKGQAFVVSHFMSSSRQVSTTGSATIQMMLEAAHVKDISAQIANGLAGKGLNATARVDYQVRDLKENELLIRGALLGDKSYSHAGGFYWGYFLTIGIFGCFGPSPFAMEDGIAYSYRVEVIDSQGRILLSTEDTIYAYYLVRNILVPKGSQDALNQLALNHLIKSLAGSLPTEL